jgi:hypothetical protein
MPLDRPQNHAGGAMGLLLEAEGFPRKSPWNSLRYRPAIIAFWHRQNGLDALLEDATQHDADGSDRWGTNDQGIRRASR